MTDRRPNVTRLEHAVEAKGTCPVCGKTVTRSRTFKATVPPGSHALETHAQLRVEGLRWSPDFTHNRCKGN